MDKDVKNRAYARMVVGAADLVGITLADWLYCELMELGIDEPDEQEVKGIAMRTIELAGPMDEG